MAFRWRADGGPTLNASLVIQGICTSIAKTPYIFVIFPGGIQTPAPPLWIRTCITVFNEPITKALIHVKHNGLTGWSAHLLFSRNKISYFAMRHICLYEDTICNKMYAVVTEYFQLHYIL